METKKKILVTLHINDGLLENFNKITFTLRQICVKKILQKQKITSLRTSYKFLS